MLKSLFLDLNVGVVVVFDWDVLVCDLDDWDDWDVWDDWDGWFGVIEMGEGGEFEFECFKFVVVWSIFILLLWCMCVMV